MQNLYKIYQRIMSSNITEEDTGVIIFHSTLTNYANNKGYFSIPGTLFESREATKLQDELETIVENKTQLQKLSNPSHIISDHLKEIKQSNINYGNIETIYEAALFYFFRAKHEDSREKVLETGRFLGFAFKELNNPNGFMQKNTHTNEENVEYKMEKRSIYDEYKDYITVLKAKILRSSHIKV